MMEQIVAQIYTTEETKNVEIKTTYLKQKEYKDFQVFTKQEKVKNYKMYALLDQKW